MCQHGEKRGKTTVAGYQFWRKFLATQTIEAALQYLNDEKMHRGLKWATIDRKVGSLIGLLKQSAIQIPRSVRGICQLRPTRNVQRTFPVTITKSQFMMAWQELLRQGKTTQAAFLHILWVTSNAAKRAADHSHKGCGRSTEIMLFFSCAKAKE